MTPLLWTVLALATPPATPASTSSSSPEARLQRTLTGPACGRATLRVVKRARYGWLWSDHEAFEVRGTLRAGVWSFESWEVLADKDPSEALEDGPRPFPAPGIGRVPGGDDLDLRGAVSALADGRWRWSAPDGSQLTLDISGDVHLRVPRRQTDPAGAWVEDLRWTVEVDARGWPVAERGTMKAGDAQGVLDVSWSLTYAWRRCGK